jgi:alcohol dehydrogenase class IV
MDCGKAVALLARNPGTVQAMQANPGVQPGVPVIAVPTTAGTGSETNSACVITNTALGRKTYVMHPSIVPRISVLDPELTLALPRYPTATCAFDVFTHATEAYTSARTTPYSDAVALEAIRLVVANARAALADGSDVEVRGNLLLASCMAAIAFNVAGLGACHGTGHPLSARLNAAHGQTLATMMPHVMGYNLDVVAARYAQVANIFGVARGVSAEDDARACIEAVKQLRADLGLERSIRELGGSDNLLPMLVEDSLADPVNLSNPKPLDRDAFESLFRAAW